MLLSVPSRSLLLFSLLLACGGTPPAEPQADAGQPLPPAPGVTALSPQPGPFNGTLAVTLTTDRPATVFVTLDGTDPRVDSPERVEGPSPLTLTLEHTATLRFFSRTAEGAEEAVQGAAYVRAGGPPGTVSGVVVVGTVALGRPLALVGGGAPLLLGTPDAAAEVPFTLSGLTSGTYRLSAMSDRNGDDAFTPVVDEASDTVAVTLDVEDPFRASVEGLRLYLGASTAGLATLTGTITLPEPAPGQSLSVVALSASSLGAGMDPQQLLGLLQNGYQVLTDGTSTRIPYALTNLAPDTYVPVAVLGGLGGGSMSLNLLFNPLRPHALEAGEVGKQDFAFGPSGLLGTLAVTPTEAPAGFVYGVVGARALSLTQGMQAVLLPAPLAPTGEGVYLGGFGGSALWSGATFQLQAFSSVESESPMLSALSWLMGASAGQTSVKTQAEDVTVQLTLP